MPIILVCHVLEAELRGASQPGGSVEERSIPYRVWGIVQFGRKGEANAPRFARNSIPIGSIIAGCVVIRHRCGGRDVIGGTRTMSAPNLAIRVKTVGTCTRLTREEFCR